MSRDRFDYPAMIRAALRAVLRQCLEIAATEGLPGAHCFYLTFRTHHPEVEIPRFLRDQYPEEMTIILEHQYRDLAVDDEAFSVTLSFGGAWHRIFVPFDALVSWVDPSAEFGLRFSESSEESAEAESAEAIEEAAGDEEAAGRTGEGGAAPIAAEFGTAAAAGPSDGRIAEVVPFGRPRPRRDD